MCAASSGESCGGAAACGSTAAVAAAAQQPASAATAADAALAARRRRPARDHSMEPAAPQRPARLAVVHEVEDEAVLLPVDARDLRAAPSKQHLRVHARRRAALQPCRLPRPCTGLPAAEPRQLGSRRRRTFHVVSLRRLPAVSSFTASFICCSKSSTTSSISSHPSGGCLPLSLQTGRRSWAGAAVSGRRQQAAAAKQPGCSQRNGTQWRCNPAVAEAPDDPAEGASGPAEA